MRCDLSNIIYVIYQWVSVKIGLAILENTRIKQTDNSTELQTRGRQFADRCSEVPKSVLQ